MKDLTGKLESYRHLLEDDSGRYVLIQILSGSQGVETCVVYDLATKTGLIEEDDDVSRELKYRLAAKGVPMLSTIP